ncbi:MAG: hypothetical protein M3P46_06245 [Actinomycetota bacterium]|nr:hypothetical protein [Actinomycetota bacterium]
MCPPSPRGARPDLSAPDLSAPDLLAPDLGGLRVLGSGRTAALLGPDGAVLWWCAPEFDDAPLCWRLLDPHGGAVTTPGLALVDREQGPARPPARTCGVRRA